MSLDELLANLSAIKLEKPLTSTNYIILSANQEVTYLESILVDTHNNTIQLIGNTFTKPTNIIAY